MDAECSVVLWFQLEKAFQKQQQDEIAARQAEKERVERERLEARKRQEVQRITEVWSPPLFFNLFIYKIPFCILVCGFDLPLSSILCLLLDIRNLLGITLFRSVV